MGKMTKRTILMLVICAAVFGGSCRMLEILAGGERAGTVDALWSDVPPISDAKRADLAIPLAARLVIRAAMQGKVNFIAFTSGQTADEIRNFYNNQRMQAAGWTPSEKGCVGDREEDRGNGAICFFSRKGNGRDEGLAIIVAEDEKTKQTEIFYARIDMTAEDKDKGRAEGAGGA